VKTLRALTSKEFAVAEERLLHPESGSQRDNARRFGVDLTLLIAQLRLTPADRARKLESTATEMEKIHAVRRAALPSAILKEQSRYSATPESIS
jgi:hypothetical protein